VNHQCGYKYDGLAQPINSGDGKKHGGANAASLFGPRLISNVTTHFDYHYSKILYKEKKKWR